MFSFLTQPQCKHVACTLWLWQLCPERHTFEPHLSLPATLHAGPWLASNRTTCAVERYMFSLIGHFSQCLGMIDRSVLARAQNSISGESFNYLPLFRLYYAHLPPAPFSPTST